MGHMTPLIVLGIVLGLLAAVQALSSNPGQLEGAQDTTPDSSISLASSAKHGQHHRVQHRKSKQHSSKSHSDNSYKAPSRHESDNKPYDHDGYGEHQQDHDSYPHDSTPSESYPPHEQYRHDSYDPYPDHESYYSPYNDPYWGPRYRAKAKLIACVKHAVALFDTEDASTWQYAGEALAECLKEFFHGCHDVPGLDIELTSTLPFALFINALDTYVTDPGSMQAAAAVFNFYFIGGQPDSEYYLGDDSCPAKLTALLQSGAYYSRNTAVMNSLANMVMYMMDDHPTQWGSSALAACKADIPAVLLALSSTYCLSTLGKLYNAFDPANAVDCTYNPDTLYENSAGAKLGAAIISGLFLSKRPKLMHFGFQLAWNMNLLALAGTYTSNFTACPREIQDFLDGFPDWSGPLGGIEVRGIDTPSAASKQVLCASIAAMMGGPVFMATNGGGDGENVLWQGTANVYNALFKEIQAIQADTTTDDPYYEYYYGSRPRPSITQHEIAGLCAATKAVYSIDRDGPTPPGTNITVVVPAPTLPGETSRPCYTSSQPVPASNIPGVPPAKPFEGLNIRHTLNLGSRSPAAAVCGWNAPVNCGAGLG